MPIPVIVVAAIAIAAVIIGIIVKKVRSAH